MHLGYIHAGCALTGSLTVVSAILAAVCLRLHAEATVDLSPVMMSETLQLTRAVVVRFARLLPEEKVI